MKVKNETLIIEQNDKATVRDDTLILEPITLPQNDEEYAKMQERLTNDKFDDELDELIQDEQDMIADNACNQLEELKQQIHNALFDCQLEALPAHIVQMIYDAYSLCLQIMFDNTGLDFSGLTACINETEKMREHLKFKREAEARGDA